MNEIIDDLKNQALEWAVETLDPDQVNEYEWAAAIDKKFAELIVRECVTKMASEIMDEQWVDDAVENTYKHFGVKE